MKNLKLILLTMLLPLVAFAQTAPQITTTSMPNGTVGKQYSQQLEAADYAEWGIASGSLPPGLHLSDYGYSSITYISGTPTKAGTYNFTVKTINVTSSDTKQFSITISAEQQKPTITTNTLSNGKVGQSYWGNISSDLTANWSIEGDLPSWLNLSDYGYSNSIYISGTPTVAGAYSFTVKATNTVGSDTKTFTINIAMPQVPQITTTSLSNGTIGEQYSRSLNAADYAEWSIASGSLPPGLQWSSSGYISGYPTKVGIYTFTVKATNVTSSDTKQLSITIGEAQLPPTITTNTLSNGKVGQSYWENISSDRAANWSIEGSLPPGLELSNYDYGSNIYISGTPTAAGKYTFKIIAANSIGSDEKTFTITINEVQLPPIITTTDLPSGKVGQYYGSINISSNRAANWSVEGKFPEWLSLENSDNSNRNYIYIYGSTPTAAGDFTFKVVAANSIGRDEKIFTIKIEMPQAPQITTTSLPAGTVGEQYSKKLEAADYAEWGIASGSLPPGLGLSSDGYIQGTPTTPNTYTFTVKATNVTSSATKQFSITIGEEQKAPTITTNTLSNGKVGQSYYANISSNCASNWSIEGNLPPGLYLSSDGFRANTYINGTPTAAGEFTFKVTAANSVGSDKKTFTINVAMPEAPQITTTSLPTGTVGEQYSKRLEAADYAEWSIASGSLPPGLELNSNGYIHGIPTTPNTYTFTVKATNVTGSETKQFSITIGAEQQAPTITTSNTFSNGKVGQYYGSINISSNRAAIWSIEGDLPEWISWDNNNDNSYRNYIYIYCGTPTAAGEFTFKVTAANSVGSDKKTFTINVAMPEAPVIATADLPNGTVGEYYSQRLEASDYANWSIVSGNLPTGLQWYSDGSIFGTPTKAGTYSFTVKAANVSGNNTKNFTITIAAEQSPPTITTNTLSNSEVGQSYYANISSNLAANWNIEGSLPPGLELSNYGYSSSIYINGTPTTAGKYTFKVIATNSVGNDEKNYTITIAAEQSPPVITYPNIPSQGTEGQDYRGDISSDRVASWSIVDGSLPPGLKLENNYSRYNYILGYPTVAAAGNTYTFTVKAENSVGSDTKTFTITISAEQQPPEITYSYGQSSGWVGRNYSSFAYFNSSRGATWSVEGNLPPGLEIYSNGNSSSINGIPTTVGKYTFTVKAENSAGSDTKTFITDIAMPSAPIIATASLPSGTVDKSYRQSFYSSTEATGYVYWSRTSGNLPLGIELNSNGYISGFPTAAGIYTFTVKAENAAGSDTKTYTITIVDEQLPPTITTDMLQCIVDSYCSRSIYSDRMTNWSIEGDLPDWLYISNLSYKENYIYISGTPTTEGEYTFKIKATNSFGSDEKIFTITITTEQQLAPIHPPQIASIGKIQLHATANTIVLENLPSNTKIEMYNMQGKQIYSSNSGNSQTLRIQVAKGMYVVKAGTQTMRAVVK